MREMYRRDFAAHPGLYAQRVRANVRQVREEAVSPDDPLCESMREYLSEEVPFGALKTLTFLAFGLATCFDQMRHGKWLEAEDSVAKLLVACEQAALDNGYFKMAWLLTHMAEPPWARLLTRGATLRDQQFGRLSDPA